MTDEIFVNEKTGKRYRMMSNCFLKEIIEPTLEVGDWIMVTGERFFLVRLPDKSCFDSAVEIRKANGEIWVKENNEWRKK